MIEILNIFAISIIYSLIIFAPTSEKVFSFKFLRFDKISEFRLFFFLIVLNIIWFLSVLDLNLKFIISSVLFFYFIIFFLSLKKKLFFEKNYFFYLFFFSLVIFILAIDISHNLFLYWDAQKLWLPKALLFYNNETISNLGETEYQHYSYLGSLFWAFFWKFFLVENEYVGRIFYITIFCFSIFNFLELFNFSKKKFLIAFLFFILLIYDYWHLRGYQEILIFSFLLICSKYLFLILRENKSQIKNFVLFFLSLNLIIWIKNEGIIFSLILNFLFILFLNRKAKFKFLLSLLFISLIFIRFFIFKFYHLDYSISNDFNFYTIPQTIIENFNIKNIIYISKYLIISFFKFPHILLSLFCALIIFFDKKLLRKCYFLYFYLLASIILIFFIYLSSNQIYGLDFMVRTSLFRIVFELSPPYLLFILILFKNIQLKLK